MNDNRGNERVKRSEIKNGPAVVVNDPKERMRSLQS